MRAKGFVVPLVMAGAAAAPVGLAQEVFFQVSPRTTPINVNPGSVVGPPDPTVFEAEPGTTLAYQLSVFVQPTPAFPNVNGLAAFNVDILTTLGVPQQPLTSFDGRILQSFVVSPSLGFPVDDDILDIGATQNLAGITNPGVGLGAWQVLGSGELILPNVEGDFQVTVVGSADVLTTAVNPFSPILQPATVGQSAALVVQTRVPSTQPANGDDDSDFRDVGASLVNVCFPGAALFLPACMAGLAGLRCTLRRSGSRDRPAR